MALNATIPITPNTPLADASGNISPTWLAFFRSLLQRTGGTAGVSSADNQATITKLVAAQAAQASAGSISAEAAARAAADSAEAAARTAADQALATRITTLGATPATLLTRLWFGNQQ